MHASLKKFLGSDQDGTYCIGHASVLVRLAGKIILFDPVFGNYAPYGENWNFWPKQIDCTEILGYVDAIVVSHIHADHLCPPVLKAANKPVHIMAGRPNIAHRLMQSAPRIPAHPPLLWGRLVPGVEVFFAPHKNGIDSLVVLRSQQTTVVLGSDCFMEKPQLVSIAQKIGRVDIAHVPYALVFWWPFLQKNITADKRRKEAARVVNQVANQARDFCAALKPTVAIGTGADLYYAGGRDHPLNRHLLIQAPPPPVQRFIAGDYVLMKAGALTFRFSGALDGKSFPAATATPLDLATSHITPSKTDLARIRLRLQAAGEVKGVQELLINEVVVNLATRNVTHRVGEPPRGYYRFEVDAPIYRDWLAGKIRFEDVLGSRRFEFSRDPDVWSPSLFDLFNNFL